MADKGDLRDRRFLRQEAPHLGHGNGRGPLQRKPVHSGADGWKGDGSNPPLDGQRQAISVARRQQIVLAGAASSPDRANGVNDPPRRQLVACGDPGFPGWAAAQRATLRQKLRARRAMDGAIYPTAPQKRGVGRVDDGVDALP